MNKDTFSKPNDFIPDKLHLFDNYPRTNHQQPDNNKLKYHQGPAQGNTTYRSATDPAFDGH
ncbi:hypothetical protein [Chitinophaga sp. CF418]|uniref:hypothetical protein n=1 Tax=Chitinophaga sp. CF418 TaxID=1855287 RepID=UPI00091057EF|nr:hypothetical protein [Chitinophaga sp. CF418]SHM51796.1 hypothetical protein SAMN05216311_102382 [Chitinophaga sp. CF418]